MKKRLFIYILLQLTAGWLSAQVYHVGDLFTAEDGSQGIVYYLFPDGGGWVVALQDSPLTPLLSGTNIEDIPNLPNHNPGYYKQLLMMDTAGYSNTLIIRQYVGTGTSCGINNIDFEHGWYLPAVAQLAMLYAQLPLIETALTAAGGSTLSTAAYISSTEEGSNWSIPYFWTVDFSDNGDFGSLPAMADSYHSALYPIRAIRSFSPPENTYDTTLTYRWNTGSTEPHFLDVPLQTTNYTVTVSNAYGCTNSDSVVVTVLDGTMQTYYDTICQGATYNSYGFSLSAEETSSILDTVLSQTVIVENCESEISVYLTILSPVVVEIEEHAGQSFVWNGITYTEDGVYTQYFNNQYGCDSTVMLTLTLDGGVYPGPDTTAGDQEEQVLYLPNAFTPDGNGKNEIFLPKFANPDEIEEYCMEIYNRWGTLVFRSEEKTFGWNGANAPGGVYAVVVHYKFRGEKPKVVKGSVIVVR